MACGGLEIGTLNSDTLILKPQIRAYTQAHTSRSEDDLTHSLSEIVKANARLKRQEENGAPTHIIQEFAQLLQFHIVTYMDNTKPGQPVAKQRSGRYAFDNQCAS